MTTRIVIQEFNGKELELTYTIAEQIVDSEDITVHKVFTGGLRRTTYMNGEEYMDELTLRGVVIGLTNKIHIFSLAPADKTLFESLEELPMCIEFKVEPGVNLSIIPKINNQEYKTDVCPICIENLFTIERGGPVVGIGFEGCGHKFHRDCLLNSLRINDKCPICRRPILDLLPIEVGHADSDSGGGRKKTRKRKKRKKTRKTKGIKITKSR